MKTNNIKISYGLFLIFIVNFIFFLIFKYKTSLFSDVSRELYIPYAMNNGEILYKDIFNVYAPLGYQINSFITSLFGNNTKIFSLIGFFNSTFILFGLYLIQRIFTKNHTYIFSILLIITSCCFYTISQTNYIIPYSYSIIFALNAIIWSIVTLLYFYKKSKEKFLYLSFLFFGISISCKYEFIPFILILIGTTFYKKTSIKTNLICILLLISVPLLSISNLFFQGVNLTDIKQSISYILLLSKAKSVNILYTYLGFIPNINSIKELIINFLKVTLFTSLITFIPYILRNKKFLFYSSIILVFIILTYLLNNTFIESNAFYFNWIGILAIILFIFKYREIQNNKLLLILFLSTILCSFKCIFNISFNSYGTYYFPLIFISCTTFLITNTNVEDKTKKVIISTILLLIGTLYLSSNIQRNYLSYSGKLVTEKGNIYTEETQIKALSETINYLKENTQKTDRILVLPEGAIINYLTNRMSHNKFYYLIPPNIEVFKEKNIVNELEKDLPEYLILQPMSYTNFNETYFCESFGTGICNLIPKYYEKPIVFGNDFWLAVYKLKEK